MTARRCRVPETALLLFHLLLIFVLLFRLTSLTPLLMDDYDYSFSWATGERLSGIGDVLRSQAAHWQLWGGRSVAHFLTQTFLLLGKPVFHALNPVVYLLLLVLILRLGNGQVKWWRLLCVHLALFLLLPGFGTVFLWLDGACNYLWCTLLALYPLLLTARIEEGSFSGKAAAWIFSILLCFLAGWTNENTACGVFAGRILWLIFRKSRNERVCVPELISFAAELAGMLLLLFAPGNFVRAAAGSASLLTRLRGMLATLLYVAAYASPLAVCGFVPLPSEPRLRERFFVLAAAGLFSGLAMAVSPEFSPRTLTGMAVLMLAALMTVLSSRSEKESVKKISDTEKRAAFVLLTALVLVSGWNAVSEVKAHAEAWQLQIERIEAAVASGEESVAIQEIPTQGRFTTGVLLAQNPQDWPNRTLGRYYGIQILKE